MYSYEERIRAVKLCIKLGGRLGATIRNLGDVPPFSVALGFGVWWLISLLSDKCLGVGRRGHSP